MGPKKRNNQKGKKVKSSQDEGEQQLKQPRADGWIELCDAQFESVNGGNEKRIGQH